MKVKFKLLRVDRYIIKKFLGTYIFMIALILSISVVFDINEKIDKFMSNSAPLKAIIFDYYLNFIPYYANLFSPLFIFLAVIFFTSKMAGNTEIITLSAEQRAENERPCLVGGGPLDPFALTGECGEGEGSVTRLEPCACREGVDRGSRGCRRPTGS